jgi:hypothetical protein
MRRRHSRYEARMYDYDWFDDRYQYPAPPKKKRYGPMMFMWDMFMFLITGGFWLIWIFVREMRR